MTPRTTWLSHSPQMAEAKHTVAESWQITGSDVVPQPFTSRMEHGIYDKHTVAGIISQSSYQKSNFERRRATKRRETMINIKDQVKMTVPRMRACSVLEVAIGALET